MDDTHNLTDPQDGKGNDKEEFNALLQEEIDRFKRDREAMQQEFNKATDETSPLVTKESLKAAAPTAVEMIILLISHADSESVRLSASKYVLDVVLGKSKLEDSADGFENLIEQLMNTKEPKEEEEGAK